MMAKLSIHLISGDELLLLVKCCCFKIRGFLEAAEYFYNYKTTNKNQKKK